MRLTAVVVRPTGEAQHTAGELAKGERVPAESLQATAWLEISEEDDGFFLLHFNVGGECFADTWHQTLDDAKRQAEFEFGIAAGEWTPVAAAGQST
jgi:hypothetical protein